VSGGEYAPLGLGIINERVSTPPSTCSDFSGWYPADNIMMIGMIVEPTEQRRERPTGEQCALIQVANNIGVSVVEEPVTQRCIVVTMCGNEIKARYLTTQSREGRRIRGVGIEVNNREGEVAGDLRVIQADRLHRKPHRVETVCSGQTDAKAPILSGQGGSAISALNDPRIRGID